MKKLQLLTLAACCALTLSACDGEGELPEGQLFNDDANAANTSGVQGLILGDDSSTDTDGDGRSNDEEGTGDLDGDGDVDVVILNWHQRPTILRNDSARENHWLQVQLRGRDTNREGVGAHVKVTAGDLTQVDEVHSGRGYQSHYGTRLHFGLGKRSRVVRVEVRWIGGGVDVLNDVSVDQLVTITEGAVQTAP